MRCAINIPEGSKHELSWFWEKLRGSIAVSCFQEMGVDHDKNFSKDNVKRQT
jgi:hypothetical protein